MAKIRNQIRFRLNDQLIELDDITPALTLLDFLRLDQKLCGTKEGCAEGDCGACTVLVGRLSGGELVYESVNACIRFVGSLDACHVVTVEHLKSKDGKLHPVQQAMVDNHASQCGFCTPGFVMSLYGLWMTNPKPSNNDIETALQGNLCRCTGYEPIIHAAQSISKNGKVDDDPLILERQSVKRQLVELSDGARVEIHYSDELLIVPSSVEDLADARQNHPDSTIVAGSTDVGLWVTKMMRNISPAIFISHLEELHGINTKNDSINVGACVTYTEMQGLISSHLPQLKEYWNRIGGEQVRNMGTIGGNVANGSPIGDTPPILIALGATVTLRCGKKQRSVLLQEFFIDYGKQDREPGDFVESINIPLPAKGDVFAAYKVSKRRDEDISAVCSAFKLRISDGVVSDAIIAFGGMAGIPKRASDVEAELIGKPWNEENVSKAKASFDKDFTPLSDWRASAEYRALIAKNLLQRFFLESTDGNSVTRLNRDKAA